MKPIPLATQVDIAQVERLRPFVEGRACVVVGSAPLSTRTAEIEADEFVIPVNGAISSVAGHVPLWVVNSKDQDRPGANIRQMHKTMLQQAAGRWVRHICFLRGPKVASEQSTLTTLRGLNCSHMTFSVLDKPTKRWMEERFCDRDEVKRPKSPCSSGLLTVAAVLSCGAASVRLVGFSFKPGYHYLPKERPAGWWRDHVEADKRALIALRARFGDRLASDCLKVAA